MVNIKKSITHVKHFVIILTLLTLLVACAQGYMVTKIEAKQININQKAPVIAQYENYIAPYRTKINNDLSTVLAYSPEALERGKGEWQTNIGDFLANSVLEKVSPIFFKRNNKNIDFCILNYGGIRASMPKGDVTTRNAFEIMPFENTSIVVELKGEQVLEMVNQIITDKKPHPVANITFTIDSNNKPKNIKIKNEDLDVNRVYYVITSDYLSNGGDNMTFFKKKLQSYDLDYKLRNVLIDKLKDIDTIPTKFETKITKE